MIAQTGTIMAAITRTTERAEALKHDPRAKTIDIKREGNLLNKLNEIYWEAEAKRNGTFTKQR